MSCDWQYFMVQLEKLCIKTINTSVQCMTSASVTTESQDLDSPLLSLAEEIN